MLPKMDRDRGIETEISKIEMEEEKEVVPDAEEMEEKKKKVSKKGKKKKDDRVLPEIAPRAKVDEGTSILQIPGLKKVKLTSLTQKIMGCIVGEHVTAESPWTTISKVVVDENLYLHHESSDFLPVKDDLMEYTAPTILVGYDVNYMPYEGEDFHRFYIAVTENARDKVLASLEEEKRLTEERLKNSINKTILPWKSLGSEVEVDESIVRNTRPLIQLELETEIDELLKPVKFTDCNAEDTKDGYLRIGPGRREFNAVKKLKVDAAIQSVPSLTVSTAQTDPGLPVNAWTQYSYDMKTAEQALMQSELKELNPNHIFQEQEYMEKSLEYNEYFDLYINDYPLLVLNEADKEVPHKSAFEEYEAYTDVNHSRNKLISSIAWHPMCTGIVALAYAVAVRCVSAADIDLQGEEVNRDVFSKNYVLLWSFKDALKPLLILESPREVHALAWSPVDANLLIGGCTSGQVIIWDLSGKVEAVECQEYLTPDQQRYRFVMEGLIAWVQPQPPPQYVRPAALSNLQSSHGGRVTQIQWLPPTLLWTENGHLVKAEVNEGISKQFLTTGEDGVIMVWDLSKPPIDLVTGGKLRKKKTRKRMSALTAQISPYKIYDRKLRPIYKLFPELKGKSTTKLTALSLHTFPIRYHTSRHYVGHRYDFFESFVFEKPETPVDTPEQDTGGVDTTVTTATSGEEFSPGEENPVDSEGREEESVEKKEKGEGEAEEGGPKGDILIKESSRKIETFMRPERVPTKKRTIPQEESQQSLKEDPFTVRRRYPPVLEPPPGQPQQIIQVVTDEGDSITLKWEGFDFHKGEEITTEEGAAISWGHCCHDGPVVSCVRSPFLEDLVLTVGGRVIALWSHQLKDRALFWKYSEVTVTCGSWSPYRPCLFHVGRSDGSMEIWDLSKGTDAPSLVQSISGKVLTYMAEHSLPLHGDKGILGVADYCNSFRMLFFPDEYKTAKPDELEILKEFVDREVRLRENYEAWNESFLKSNADEIAKIKAKEEEAERKHKEAEIAAEEEAQQRMRLEEEEARQFAKGRQGGSISERIVEKLTQERERQMQRVLMEKKRLDKSDLIAKQQPILMLKQMEKEKRRKQREKIRHQQKIFDKTVAMLFPEVVEKPKEGPSVMDEFEAELMEHQPELMAQYDSLLPSQLKFIRDNPFNKRLKWEKVFEEGMLRRNVLDFPLYLRRNRMDRYKAAKLIRQPGSAVGEIFEGKRAKVGFKQEEGVQDLDGEEKHDDDDRFDDESYKSEEYDEEKFEEYESASEKGSVSSSAEGSRSLSRSEDLREIIPDY